MSMLTMRDDLAEAASTVAGIKGHNKRPSALRAGDAWPMLRQLPRDEESGQFFALWRLVVYVPQDEAAALEFTDQHVEPLIDALTPYAYVESAGPAILQTGPSQVMVLEILLRGEM